MLSFPRVSTLGYNKDDTGLKSATKQPFFSPVKPDAFVLNTSEKPTQKPELPTTVPKKTHWAKNLGLVALGGVLGGTGLLVWQAIRKPSVVKSMIKELPPLLAAKVEPLVCPISKEAFDKLGDWQFRCELAVGFGKDHFPPFAEKIRQVLMSGGVAEDAPREQWNWVAYKAYEPQWQAELNIALRQFLAPHGLGDVVFKPSIDQELKGGGVTYALTSHITEKWEHLTVSKQLEKLRNDITLPYEQWHNRTGITLPLKPEELVVCPAYIELGVGSLAKNEFNYIAHIFTHELVHFFQLLYHAEGSIYSIMENSSLGKGEDFLFALKEQIIKPESLMYEPIKPEKFNDQDYTKILAYLPPALKNKSSGGLLASREKESIVSGLIRTDNDIQLETINNYLIAELEAYSTGLAFSEEQIFHKQSLRNVLTFIHFRDILHFIEKERGTPVGQQHTLVTQPAPYAEAWDDIDAKDLPKQHF